MDTLNMLISQGSYDGLMSDDPKFSSKTPQPKRKFSEDVEKKIEPLKDKAVYVIGVNSILS